MRTIVLASFLLLSGAVCAEELRAVASRSDSDQPPHDWKGSNDIRTSWPSQATLQVVFWVPEDKLLPIRDDSVEADLRPGNVLRVSYDVEERELASGEADWGCNSFVKFTITIEGARQGQYFLEIGERTVVSHRFIAE